MTKLIDTHQHLIYPEFGSYAWTNDVPELADQGFTLENYKEITTGHEVLGTIFMEAAIDQESYQDETRSVSKLMQDCASGLLGIIAACYPESDDGYDAWLEECCELGVVGFRRVLHVVDDEMSKSDRLRNNVRKIGAQGKVFDMCFSQRQLPIAAKLSSACDNTSLMVDHCGVPVIGIDFSDWKKMIKELASMDHVNCKLSGILAYCQKNAATLETVRPYIDHVIESFGTKRLVWGSDWPVVNTTSSLPKWLDITAHFLAELSDDEKADIGWHNAVLIYSLKII